MRPTFELALGVASFCASIALVLPQAPVLPRAEPRERVTTALRAAPASLTASYTLTARLDEALSRVDGRGTIEFVNTSNAPVGALFVHLYLNAFKNDRTLFLRSPFGAGRSALRPEAYGYLDVKHLRARELGQLDLWPARVRHSPGDPDDETDIEVPLPEPLAPGARLTLDVAFEARLPSLVERTGHAGRFHFAGQWFPKLAKLGADGRFVHFPFHPHAEFFADYGRYDVTLDVPAAFSVGATGARQSSRTEGGRRIERYVAEPVHDFAWTAWDGFVERTRTLDGLSVRLLAPRDHQANATRTLDAIELSLPHFEKRFGRYPYPTLTVVHPPEGAEPAGGMEYPTLITTGGPWYTAASGVRALEAVTVHELGHQWFYGLIGSNEVATPFLDEGLTSYAELSFLEQWLGPASLGSLLGLSVSSFSVYRVAAASSAHDEAIAKPAAEFSSFQNLGSLVYARTAVLLESVARVFGREKLDKALRAYAEAQRFAHPTAADLLAKIEEHVGADAREVVERGLFQRGSVNYLVRDIQTAKARSAAGYFERASGRERVVAGPEPAGFHSSVTIYRHGTLRLPIEVLLVSANGSRRTQHWDGRGSYRVFDHTGDSPLVRVVIDPEQKVLIDDDLMDNSALAERASLARVTERMAYAGALLLGGVLP